MPSLNYLTLDQVFLDQLRCEDRGFPQLKTTALRLRRQENRRHSVPTWRNMFW